MPAMAITFLAFIAIISSDSSCKVEEHAIMVHAKHTSTRRQGIIAEPEQLCPHELAAQCIGDCPCNLQTVSGNVSRHDATQDLGLMS